MRARDRVTLWALRLVYIALLALAVVGWCRILYALWRPIVLLGCLALAACTTTPDIPRIQACQEQADAWCAVLDPGRPADDSGCGIVYRYWCGQGGLVSADAQDLCLSALGDMHPDPLTGYSVPDACQATWATR